MVSKRESARQIKLRTKAYKKWTGISKKLSNITYLIESECGYCMIIADCFICPMREKGVCGCDKQAMGLVNKISGVVTEAQDIAEDIWDIIEQDIIEYKKAIKGKLNGKRRKTMEGVEG